jgi:hypothetical protein
MDYKKIAILSSVIIVVVGVGAIGFLAYRARQPAAEEAPASAETPPTVAAPVPPAAEGAGGTGEAAARPKTTVTPPKTPPKCDTRNSLTDCDFDGLNNAEEAQYKTDPAKADTDGDGLSDYGEVRTWNSDPLNPKSIDPAMTDLEAVNAGKRDTRSE